VPYEYLTQNNILQFIDAALLEDVGDGDHSSLAAVPADKEAQARLIIKAEGILAGVDMAKHILKRVDNELSYEVHIEDGAEVKFGDIGMHVKGKARSILKAERLLLNCMQRMSGIATYTHKLKKLINHTHTQLLDTRKTTPNFRLPEKWAVKIGGGTNHRYGLFDMIMLKDNHIDYAGGIENAIRQTQAYLKNTGKSLRIEVETRNLNELQQVLDIGGIDVIMLDNYALEDMRTAVQLVNKQYQLEASGGITEQSIVAIAETGVDFISVGALTHSAKSLDISLKAF
jgi:nicotinate-nucleotide pyrophosphorylase (carboxylating)